MKYNQTVNDEAERSMEQNAQCNLCDSLGCGTCIWSKIGLDGLGEAASEGGDAGRIRKEEAKESKGRMDQVGEMKSAHPFIDFWKQSSPPPPACPPGVCKKCGPPGNGGLICEPREILSRKDWRLLGRDGRRRRRSQYD